MTNTVDHWAAHPGWLPGRRLLTLLIPFGHHETAAASATALHRELGAAGLVPCDPASLHQTIYTFGWRDELESEHVGALERSLEEAFAAISPFELTLGPLEAGSEGVWLQVRPEEPLMSLRLAALEADGAAKPASALFGHASVGYCAGAVPRQPLDALAERHGGLIVGPLQVTSVDLVWLSRSAVGYGWERINRIALGSR